MAVSIESSRIFDAHGFAVLDPSDEGVSYEHMKRGKPKSAKQMAALQKLLHTWDESSSALSIQLQNLIFHGFPHEFRSELWKKLLETKTLKEWTDFDYKEEVARVREQLVDLGVSEYMSGNTAATCLADMQHNGTACVKFGHISLDTLRHIFLDLERTYPQHVLYRSTGDDSAGRRGRAALFRVLAVYARFNGSVGYCQGMAASAGLLLMVLRGSDTQGEWDTRTQGDGTKDIHQGARENVILGDTDMITQGILPEDTQGDMNKDTHRDKGKVTQGAQGNATQGDMDINTQGDLQEDTQEDLYKDAQEDLQNNGQVKREMAEAGRDDDDDVWEEEAFWALLSLMERNKYLVGYFDNHMVRLHTHGAVFDKLAENRFPKLLSHLHECGVESLMFLTPWFLSVYTALPCWDTVLAIWDLLLTHGHSSLFRVALTILDLLQDELLMCSSLDTILPKLLHIPASVCEFDTFMGRLSTVLVYDWEVTSILAGISKDKSKKRPCPPAIKRSRGQAAKRRRAEAATTAHTPQKSSFLTKVTRIFRQKTPCSTPNRRSRTLATPLRKRAARAKRMPLKTLNISQNEVGSKHHSKRGLPGKMEDDFNGCIGDHVNTNNDDSTTNNNDDTKDDDNYALPNIKSNDSTKNDDGCKNSPHHNHYHNNIDLLNNNNNNNSNNIDVLLSHPLEQLLLRSPHTAVSPAVMRKIRVGPDSPLARLGHRSQQRRIRLFSPSPQRIVRSTVTRGKPRPGAKVARPGFAKRVEIAKDKRVKEDDDDMDFLDTVVDGTSLAAAADEQLSLQHFLAPLPLRSSHHQPQGPACTPRELYPLGVQPTQRQDSKNKGHDGQEAFEFHGPRLDVSETNGSGFCEPGLHPSPKMELLQLVDATKTLITGTRLNKPI